ncbi:hypothetical protein DNTS_021642 [Danionella cerebrum]|uniref:BolA family member 3 n=1 Tax=Danionella cerebrum TaxID=2873325 RepID=A0A553QTF9_9TELE|nr:hypothetical protein DNTS_021642 [Danionella translucida]
MLYYVQPQVLRRNIIARSASSLSDGELRITQLLKEKFPQATSLKVLDISGGCGAMYEIHIESDEFKGKRTVQQHQLVNQASSLSTEWDISCVLHFCALN